MGLVVSDILVIPAGREILNDVSAEEYIDELHPFTDAKDRSFGLHKSVQKCELGIIQPGIDFPGAEVWLPEAGGMDIPASGEQKLIEDGQVAGAEVCAEGDRKGRQDIFIVFCIFRNTGNQNMQRNTFGRGSLLYSMSDAGDVPQRIPAAYAGRKRQYRRMKNLEIKKEYMEQARRLHRDFPVVDAHLDLAGELLFRVENGEENPLHAHYLNNFRAGGLNVVVSSVYIREEELPEKGLRSALDQISVLLSQIDKNEEFAHIRTAEDMEQVIREDRIGILLYMEGLDAIGRDRKLLRILWELGVRGASLTWSRRNALANGCCKAGQRIQIPGGLSSDGCAAVREMERLGMFLDVSHLNDDGFEDVCRIAKKPFAATHSNSRTVSFNYRNLSDGQMKKLGEHGGVMGLNGCGCIAGCTAGEEPLEMLCRHVEYEVSVIGIDRVGYGFDFCDSYEEAEPKMPGIRSRGDCLKDHSHIPELTAALLQRGMSAEDAKKLIGGNWTAYFRNMLPRQDMAEMA